MKMLLRANDISKEEVTGSTYDFALFASGYEARAVFLPKLLDPGNILACEVLGFDHAKQELSRRENDAHYQRRWERTPIIADGNDDAVVYQVLRTVRKDAAKILVDYSSMSRIWYNGVINWASLAPEIENVTVDFVYSVGRYRSEFRPLRIESILALPGCETANRASGRSVVVFGLGFDATVALSVIDRVEPDDVYALVAAPGASDGDDVAAISANEVLINEYLRTPPIEAPLRSVAATARIIQEVILPDVERENVMLVPLGPKPHVLAAMIVSRIFRPRVGCLRVAGSRNPRVDVQASGALVATRVEFGTPRH